ncbi:TPA: hypothetical protein EYP83_00200 [Candidatus Geothermarchaeota archaeon]|nr:hypothetical protein [Candidatus Geothermarchaeota archaeon]HIQ13095.1 hypothetical protein [Thermoprotei archaeon]
MTDESIKIPKNIFYLDEILIKFLPKEYNRVVEHYINSKIELLKAVDEFIDLQIKRLEEVKRSLKEEPKREKLEVE